MHRTFFLIVCFAVFSFSAASSAEAKGGDNLRAKVQNPVSSIYSLPLKLTVNFGAPDGSAYFFNANPVIPVTVGDWKLNSRAFIPAWISVDGFIEGTPDILQGRPSADRKNGLGDINYSLFFSPHKSKPFIWGVGPWSIRVRSLDLTIWK
jgi:hypothetical protein